MPLNISPKPLHIIDSGGLYGAEVMLLSLVEEQLSQGLSPVIASIGTPDIVEKPLEREARKRKLPLECFRFKAGLNFKGALGVLDFAKQQQVNLLHSHGYKGNILFGLLPRRVRKLPIVTTLHGWTSTGGLTKMSIYEWLDAFCLRRVDRVVFVNDLIAGHPRLKCLNKNQTSVIDNGIRCEDSTTATIDPAIEAFIRQRYTIVCVCRFSREKNLKAVLSSVATLITEGCDIQLLLLGDGGYREQLTTQANELKISDRVLMPGHVDQVGAYLKYCQLFAMPSLTEGLPMALLEAMHAGIPIIASQVGGIPDVLLQGRAGSLISPDDQQQLTKQIHRHYHEPQAFAESVKLARERVADQYSSAAMANSYQQLYQQVLKN